MKTQVLILQNGNGNVNIKEILAKESISITDDQKSLLQKFIKNNYPDLRRVINEVQKFCSDSKLSIVDTSNNIKFANQIFELIGKGAVLRLRKHIIQSEEKFNSDYPMLLKTLFDCIHDLDIPDTKKKMTLVIVAEALYRSAFVADQEINCYSCLIQVADVLNN